MLQQSSFGRAGEQVDSWPMQHWTNTKKLYSQKTAVEFSSFNQNKIDFLLYVEIVLIPLGCEHAISIQLLNRIIQ